MADKIAFRRIRGRIVPIRVKAKEDPNWTRAVNVGKIAAGAAIAVGTGIAAARFTRAPAYARVFIRKAARAIDESQAIPLFRPKLYAFSSQLTAQRQFKAFNGIQKLGTLGTKLAMPLFWTGAIGAAALIDHGVKKLVPDEINKKHSFSRVTAVEMGTLGLAGAAFIKAFPRAPSALTAFKQAFAIVRHARK